MYHLERHTITRLKQLGINPADYDDMQKFELELGVMADGNVTGYADPKFDSM